MTPTSDLASLKRKARWLIHVDRFRRVDGTETKNQMTKAVKDFMHFYNFDRLHSTIGHTTSVKFEWVGRLNQQSKKLGETQ